MGTRENDNRGSMSSYTNEKRISRIGFIGTGPMSKWFASYLEREGYEILMTGRTSKLRPEEMVPEVDVVVFCVPISVVKGVLQQYAPLLKPDQALITLAGKATDTIDTALEHTSEGVEVMNVHNLWGPLATDMKGKNVIITKTKRSGKFCEEFENLFHKHGAIVTYDPPRKHDLMMAIEQKLPTAFSVALASTLRKYGRKYGIGPADIKGHSTLTSIYAILGMARIHGQSHRTYAEILSFNKEYTEILRGFQDELNRVIELGEKGDIKTLEEMMKKNVKYFGKEFLREMLGLSQEVNGILSKPRKQKYNCM